MLYDPMGKFVAGFQGNYAFLSNFYPVELTYEGLTFRNAEVAFQAAKCPERMEEFCHLTGSQAKQLGRTVSIRSDWEAVKEDVMYRVCKAKFLQNPDLLEQLLKTGDAQLIEANTWGDTFWGVCRGVGENRLGNILMQLREELKGKEESNE